MADWMRKADEMNGEYEPKNKFGKDDVLQVKAGGETMIICSKQDGRKFCYRAIEDLVSRLQKSLEDKEQLRKIGRDLVKNILHKMGNWNLEKKEN